MAVLICCMNAPNLKGLYLVHHDSPDIANNCVEAAQDHTHHKEPGAPSHPEEEM